MDPTPTPDIISTVVHTPELLGVVIGMALGAVIVAGIFIWLYRMTRDK